MLRRMFMLPLLLVFFAAAGCGDDSPTDTSATTLDGSWSGESQGITLSLTLNEDSEGSLSGSGSLSDSEGSAALTVSSGTHVPPNVTMTLSSTGLPDLNFSGEVSGDNVIIGALEGGGLSSDFDITLSRQ